MLSLIPEPFRLYVTLGLVALAIAAGAWAYHAVYTRGYDAATIAAQKQMDEQQAANDRALAAAEKSLREDVAAMKQQNDQLEKKVATLDEQAAQDPGAHACGVSAGSVRRLNAVR